MTQDVLPSTVDPYESVYLAIVDAILETTDADDFSDRADLAGLIDEEIRSAFPDLDDAGLMIHYERTLHYLSGAMLVMGMKGPMPGTPLNIRLNDEEAVRPMLVCTGVIAAVVFLKQKESLEPFTHWILPPAQQAQMSALLAPHFGLSRDVAQVSQFPFLPEDFERLGVETLLTESVVTSLQGGDLAAYDLRFRQAVLRRQSAAKVWKMPDGMLAVPFFLPVTVVSMLAPFFWMHGQEDELEVADAMGRIIADALAAREFLDDQAEVYCGHLHVGRDVAEIAVEVAQDLSDRGGVPIRNPVRTTSGRIGRNGPCACGSGLKSKKCCAP